MVGILSTLPITATGSALQANAGSVGASVLQASRGNGATALLGDIGSTTKSLITQIKANANQRLVDKQQEIAEVTRLRREAIDVQNERWISVKAQINNAQVAVDSGRESVKSVANSLLLLRGSVAGTTQDPKFYRGQFNDFINKINNESESSSKLFNLVGNISPIDYSPNQIEYRKNTGTGVTTLTGTHVGTHFRIMGTDGKIWEGEPGTDTLQAYADLGGPKLKYTTTGGETLNMATSTRNGLKLIKYNQETRAIAVEITVVPNEAPIKVAGTLERSGIGIMQSWFYNDLATEDDRTTAFADINRAEVNLTLASSEVEKSAAIVSIDQRNANKALDDLTAQSSKVRTDEFDKLEEARITAAQQFLAMQASLDSISREQKNYLNAFSGFLRDPFSQAMLDINA